MLRTIYNDDHEAFRQMFRDFLEREVVPVFPEWEAQGIVPKEFFRKLGDLGVIGLNMPVEYGGSGQEDYAFNAIVQEEAARAHVMLGTTCRCLIRTAVQTEELPSLRRVRNADKVLARIRPLIESAQRQEIPEPETSTPTPNPS